MTIAKTYKPETGAPIGKPVAVMCRANTPKRHGHTVPLWRVLGWYTEQAATKTAERLNRKRG